MATSLLATVASRALQRSAGSPAASLSAALGATAGCRWFSSALPDPIPPSGAARRPPPSLAAAAPTTAPPAALQRATRTAAGIAYLPSPPCSCRR